MRGRTVLFVVLAVVLALGGVYVGWSTSSPKAAADAPATPPSPVGSAQEAGSTRSRSPGTAAPKGSADKGSTEPGDQPAPPPSSKPQRPTGPVRFGQVTTAGRPSEIVVSDDRRALGPTFSDFEVIIGPAAAEPSATKSFSMTLPLTDGANGDVLGFHVSGWSATTAGATARMTLRGGGKVKVRDIPTDADVEIVESLWLPATPGITYQMSVVLEIHKDAAGGGDGFINASNIEIGIS
jgi:hypothetical protein